MARPAVYMSERSSYMDFRFGDMERVVGNTNGTELSWHVIRNGEVYMFTTSFLWRFA